MTDDHTSVTTCNSTKHSALYKITIGNVEGQVLGQVSLEILVEKDS